MSSWLVRTSKPALAALGVLGRLYGIFFLALALLFLYWGGRGLIAYAIGIRTAWADPAAAVAGLVAGGLSIWVTIQLIRRGIPTARIGDQSELDRIVDEAMKLEKTDPIKSRQLLDDYFMREAAATNARRAALRQLAPHDLNAAETLLGELQNEITSNAAVRKDALPQVPESERTSMLSDLDSTDNQLRLEVSQLESFIERLRLK